MRGAKALLATMVSVAALAGCTGGGSFGQWAGLTHPDVLAKADLKYYWNASVALLPGEYVRTVYRLDENVYLLLNSNRLVAVDAMTGRTKWSFRVAEPDDTVFFPPVHADNVVLTPGVSGIREIMKPHMIPPQQAFNAVMLNTLTQVIVLNRTTGEAVRKPGDISFTGKFVANAAGTGDAVRYYVGSPNGEYHAISLQDGVPVWTKTTSTQMEPITAPMVLYSNHLYVGNEGGGFFCTYLSLKGLREWDVHVDGGVLGGFHVDDRGCFVPSTDHRIYAFNSVTGERLWSPFICDGAPRQAIQVGENSVFQYADRDKFYCLDVATGRLRWPAIADGRLVLSAMEGNVYVRDCNNNLLVIDEMLGTRKFSLPLTGHELFTGNTVAPAIYTARRDGKIFCITPSTLTHLTLDMLKGKHAAPSLIVTTKNATPATTTAEAPKAE
jgi:outer membrane protein assembly factor BamB